MSVRSIIAGDGAGIYNTQRNLPLVQPPVTENLSSAYVRPADWPALASFTTTTQKVSGLIAITDDSDNYVALAITTSAGTYTVDWGDGTVDIVAGGNRAQHQYNYATYGGSVLTGGYKAAVVNVTPDSGDITGINLGVRYEIGAPYPGLPIRTVAKWLDISVGSPFLTSLQVGGFFNSQAVYLSWLQQFRIFSSSAAYVSILNNLFYYCFALQSIPTLNISPNYNNIGGCFAFCYSLKVAPILPPSSVTITGTLGYFFNCPSLETVTDAAFANVTLGSGNQLFFNCPKLKYAPNINFANGSTDFASMFSGCTNLISVPNYNTASATSMASMFLNCNALKTVPQFNTRLVTNFTNMFGSCFNLTSVPTFNMTSAIDIGSMFSSCFTLKSIPALNLPALVSATSAFNNCYNVQTIGQLTTSGSFTGMNQMFNNCRSLRVAPTITNTTNVTTMNSTFSTCFSLVTVPAYNTSNVNSMNSTFFNCSSLNSVPTFDTTKVTSMGGMFQLCAALTVCPAFNTSNAIGMDNMFNGCTSLIDVQFTNTSNVTNMSSMFTGCNSFMGSSTWSSWNTSKVTNMGSMFVNNFALPAIPTFTTGNLTGSGFQTMFNACQSLNTVPPLNLINCTSIGATGLSGSLVRFQASNVKVSINLSLTGLNQTALQEVFANSLIGNTTTQTINITNATGADTVLAKTGGLTASSRTITMANTVGITAGVTHVYGTGVNTGIAVSFNATADTVTYFNGTGVNGLADGDNVMFTAITTTTGIVINTTYFVVNSNGTTFQLALTAGGAAINLTNNGTGVMSIGGATINNRVLSVNPNVNIVINGYAGVTNASASLTVRNLNTNYAVTKNWTVTG